MPNETKTASSKTKIAVVTGGSRGLGKSTVLALADRGVNSIFTFVNDPTFGHVVHADSPRICQAALKFHF